MEHCPARIWPIIKRKICQRHHVCFLEIIINVLGNFNEVIILSFHGNIQEAVQHTDYQWLMFYPCLYFCNVGCIPGCGGREQTICFCAICICCLFRHSGVNFFPSLYNFWNTYWARVASHYRTPNRADCRRADQMAIA